MELLEDEPKPHGYFYQRYYKQKREEDPEYKAKKNDINRKCMNKKYSTDEEFKTKHAENCKKYYDANKEYFKQYYLKRKAAKIAANVTVAVC